MCKGQSMLEVKISSHDALIAPIRDYPAKHTNNDTSSTQGKFEERQGRTFEAMRLYRQALQKDDKFAAALQVQQSSDDGQLR